MTTIYFLWRDYVSLFFLSVAIKIEGSTPHQKEMKETYQKKLLEVVLAREMIKGM